MLYWTAFILGLLGSTHCAGMCGPIAIALGSFHDKTNRLAGSIVYNLGRLSGYLILGGAIGLLGKGMSFAGFQKYLAIVIGVLILLMLVFKVNLETGVVKIPVFAKWFAWVTKSMSKYLKQNGLRAQYSLGIFNGFLPCGLVYLALANALMHSKIYVSMLYMVAFGLGTFPAMIAISYFGKHMSLRMKKYVKYFSYVFLLIMAFFLISRGFNIKLPTDFLFWDAKNNPILCH